MAWPLKRKPTEPEERSAYFSSEVPLVSYWTYFTDRAAAEEAAERLHARDLSADLEPSAGQRDTRLVLAYMPLPESEDPIEHGSEVIKSVAATFGGQYDGWEAGPLPDEETINKIRGWLNAGVGAA